MRRKPPDVLAMVNKQTGKDAAAILNKVDKMLKQGVDRATIEKAVAAHLCTHITEQVKIILRNKVAVPCQ
jgi:hypothetical protein